jgi:putative oxidoreductase
MKRKVLIEVIASLLVLLFLYACGSKWADFTIYVGDMNNQPFPNELTSWLVWTIPPIELAIALAIAFERTRLVGFYASLVLLLIFTIYTIAVLLHAFKYIPCSCGGIIRKLSWPQHLVFTLFFAGLSLVGSVLLRRLQQKDVKG